MTEAGAEYVYENFLGRFLVLYGEPKTVDKEAFLDEYVNALKGCAAEALQRAADYLIKKHTFKSWPTVAECFEAMNITEPVKRIKSAAEPAIRESTPAEKARIKKMIDGLKEDLIQRPKFQGASLARGNLSPSSSARQLSDAERQERLAEFLREGNARMFEREKEIVRARMAGQATISSEPESDF